MVQVACCGGSRPGLGGENAGEPFAEGEIEIREKMSRPIAENGGVTRAPWEGAAMQWRGLQVEREVQLMR